MRALYIMLLVLLAGFNTLRAGEPTIFGTGVHFGFDRGQLDANLSMIKMGGFTSVRDEYSWPWAEQTKGKYCFSENYCDYIRQTDKLQLRPLNLMGYASPLYDSEEYPRSLEAVNAYAAYVVATLKTMHGPRRMVQIWNEWEGGTGMKTGQAGKGDILAYLMLLKTAYAKIKAADPGAIVVSNSFQKFQTLDEAVKMGLMRYCDGVSIHTYNYFHGQGANAESWNGNLNAMILPILRDRSGRNFPLYITEMGWPTSLVPGKGITYESAAQYFARLYLLARRVESLKGLWTYDFQDDGWNARNDEDNFGQVRPDLTPKPSWYVFRDLLNNMRGTDFVSRINTKEDNLYILRFRDAAKNDIFALWSAYPDDEWQVVLERADNAPVIVALNHAGYPPFQREWKNKLSLTLNGLPIMVKGNIGQVKVAEVIRHPYPARFRGTTPVMKLPGYASIATSRDQALNYVELKPGTPWCGDKGWRGTDDFYVQYAIQYDQKNLYFEFTVKDDVIVKGPVGDKMPSYGDRIMLKLLPPGAEKDPGSRCEFGVIQTSGGVRVYSLYVGSGKVEGKATVKTSQRNRETHYTITVPCLLLGVEKFSGGDVLGLVLTAYDYDSPQGARFTVCRKNDSANYNILLLK